MENALAKLTAAFFESIDLYHELDGENKDVIKTGFGGLENVNSVKLLLFFSEDNSNVHVIAPQLVKVPSGKLDHMYKVVNDVNKYFRWVKFLIDEDGDVQAEADCILDMDTCGQECLEIIQRTATIVDQAYPTFMKELWA